MLTALKQTLSARQRRAGRVFIAWSHDSRAVAETIRGQLRARGFSPWLSEDIEGGRRFREEIGRQIRNADLVVAVFPTSPSHWIVAEAGLAYFEQKLIPVAIDRDVTSDPFHDLQVIKLSHDRLAADPRSAVEPLVHTIEDRLGSNAPSVIPYLLHLLNFLFFTGVPIVGLTLVGCLIWLSLAKLDDPYESLQLWKAGHIVLGATLYGGAVFVALTFARAGTSRSFMERQFGVATAQRLFGILFLVALSQFAVGVYLLRLSPYDLKEHDWALISVIAYCFVLMWFLLGFIFYRSANNADKEGKERAVLERNIFAANYCFGLGLLFLTVVIILMSLKENAGSLLM